MKLARRSVTSVLLVLAFAGAGLHSQPARQPAAPATDEAKILEAMHLIQSQPLYDYVAELVSEKYGGRLTGTKEYEACVAWVESLLKGWGVEPGGDNGTYRQLFPNPYTTVFPGGVCEMHVPAGKGGVVKKSYAYEDEFIPGGHDGHGRGHGRGRLRRLRHHRARARLRRLQGRRRQGQDRAHGVRGAGRPARRRPSTLFKKWRPYSFHQYKLKNAAAHGAKGMIYNYGPIGNPNNAYVEGFVYHHVGAAVVADVFAGTGRVHKETVDRIRKELKPQSFATGKTMTISNKTEHHPDGVGINLIGKITGTDPALKDEVIIVGGHLDHLGRLWELLPGRQRQRHGRRGHARASPRPWPSAPSSPSGPSSSSSSAARSRARTRARKGPTTTPSTPSIRSIRPLFSSTWKDRGSATRSRLRAGRPIPSSGSSSRRPTRASSTACSARDRRPIRPGRGRTRPGSSGRACRP